MHTINRCPTGPVHRRMWTGLAPRCQNTAECADTWLSSVRVHRLPLQTWLSSCISMLARAGGYGQCPRSKCALWLYEANGVEMMCLSSYQISELFQ